MLIFVFVEFLCNCVLVVVFLCCHVVKLGIAKKPKTKNTPKMWKYVRVFFTRQVMVAYAKVIVFFAVFFCFFPGCSKTL